MPENPFTITVHMVSSLDGMIAKNDNSVSWFETSSPYEKGATLTDQEMADFLSRIDCYIMGRNTYEHALELSKTYGWAYGNIPTIVLTHQNLPIERENISFYSGDIHELVNQRLKPHYKNVWLVGGPAVAKDFIRLKLANELRLSVLPIILGEGKPFFDHIGNEQLLNLKDTKAYKNGMVELHYELKYT